MGALPCTIITTTPPRRTVPASGGAKTACISTCAASPSRPRRFSAPSKAATSTRALVGHFDQEPIYLYPELEERGWSHEVVESHCGDCEGGFMLRMVRWG